MRSRLSPDDLIEKRRARDRTRYANNREKMRAKNQAYHAANREKENARSNAYREANRDQVLEKKREWNELNKVQLIAQRKSKRADNHEAFIAREKHRREAGTDRAYQIKWAAENRESIAKKAAIYAKVNLASLAAKNARRRAAKLQATPKWADLEAIWRKYEEAEKLTSTTGVKHEVDHFYPLISQVVCGLHCEANLQILTQTENRRKSNRMSC